MFAAGCVLWRRSPTSGAVQVALVYRPKWADWTHPKGKLERGERARDAAVREVWEETGMTCELGPELPAARYVDQRGRRKHVRYWAAEAVGGAFAPNQEVSRLEWLAPAEAGERLTYRRDAALVPALLGCLHPPQRRPSR